jgi:hypothetical protein
MDLPDNAPAQQLLNVNDVSEACSTTIEENLK